MFRFTKPEGEVVRNRAEELFSAAFSYPEVGATQGRIPKGYSLDQSSIALGKGEDCYRRACQELFTWTPFNLNWIQLHAPADEVRVDDTVGVVVRYLGTWSIHFCRVIYLEDLERDHEKICRFAYGTLKEHAECGEERFQVRFSMDTLEVHYDILAFSRPRHWLSRTFYPLTRLLQARFRRDSGRAMQVGTGIAEAPAPPASNAPGL